MTDTFAQFPLTFRSLPDALARALRPHATVVRPKSGRTVMSPETSWANVYLVAEGRVQVILLSTAGHEVVLRNLGPGDLFGELAAIDQQPRSASVFALEDSVLISVPTPAFRQAVFATAESAEWLARRLTAQIRDLTTKVFELNALRVPSRLHCELWRICGTVQDMSRPLVIDPSPTHAELASRIGTHREAVTREMGFLVDQKILHQRGRRLTVLDLSALTKLVHLAAGHAGVNAQLLTQHTLST